MRDMSDNIETGDSRDKQLHGIRLDAVMEKRRLDQALNAKEFAICAGVSYSTARIWFHLPDFPAFRGVVFWQDFVHWRSEQHEHKSPSLPQAKSETLLGLSHLPPRAAQILHDC